MAHIRARLLAIAAGGLVATVSLFSPIAANAAKSGDVAEFHTSPANSTVCWVGNVCTNATGTYTFQTAPNSCIGNDDGAQATCNVTSSGAFTNIVCGTGSVLPSSSATISESDGDVVQINQLSITFVAGLGVSTGNAVESGPGGKSGTGAGVVNIAPSGGSTPAGVNAPNSGAGKKGGFGVCTPGFTVTGVTVGRV